MIEQIKTILGITTTEYDFILILVCCWVVIYFMYILFGVLSSAVNRV